MIQVLTPRGYRTPYREVRVEGIPGEPRALEKAVKPKHELQHPPGVAVDDAVLADASARGVEFVSIRRIKTGERLIASIAKFRSGKLLDRGFGRQRFLSWHELEPAPDSSVVQEWLFPRTAIR